jgi:hypothetical protein
MRKPFKHVNDKLREAEFFLDKLRHATELHEARFFFSAFVSAARSVTYAIQVCLSGLPDFDVWWEGRRQRLKEDPIVRYFHKARNVMTHTGVNPVEVQIPSMTMSRYDFLLAGDHVPLLEAVAAADAYMAFLVIIAREAYGKYWSSLDLPADLTVVQLAKRGTSFEDVEEELGMPRGYLGDLPAETRLTFLKHESHTDIERLTSRYATPGLRGAT